MGGTAGGGTLERGGAEVAENHDRVLSEALSKERRQVFTATHQEL